jgi:hypothetical protein
MALTCYSYNATGVRTISRDSVAYGNSVAGIPKPEHMGLAEIVAEMIQIVVKNPRVIDDISYISSSFAGQRYNMLQNELTSRERKYLRFENLLEGKGR